MIAGLRRYSRHLLIPEVGVAGQERLARARVLCVGAGGLGSPLLQYLAAAGVGRIGIIDDDVVDESNLQRQPIYSTADLGKRKALIAAQRVEALNPLVRADPIVTRFDAGNARELVRLYDVAAGYFDPQPIADKREPNEPMNGIRGDSATDQTANDPQRCGSFLFPKMGRARPILTNASYLRPAIHPRSERAADLSDTCCCDLIARSQVTHLHERDDGGRGDREKRADGRNRSPNFKRHGPGFRSRRQG